MVTTNFLGRTFLIGINDSQGTGFTIEYNEIQYLISARHVFEDVKDGETISITIFHEKNWKNFSVKAHFHTNPEIDAIVFSFKGFLSPISPIELTAGGIILGQDTFFLGFPYGMFTDDSSKINRDFPFPFVKKATFSASKFDSYEGNIAYLDGHTNPGFSGGPIIFKDLKTNKYKIIGVMRGYVVHEGEISYEEVNEDGEIEDDSFLYDENSGIIKVQEMKDVIEIIENIEK